MNLVGDKKSFAFGIAWSAAGGASAADVTRGVADVWVAGARVWGRDGLEWTWVELLEHLARFWADIVVEEGDPLDLRVEAEQLRAEAEMRWDNAPGALEEAEERALFNYLEAHDLAAGLMGVFPPSLFVTRQGDTMRVASRDSVAIVPRHEAEATLRALGDGIAARLEGIDDERAKLARSGWDGRARVDADRLLTLSTGLTQAQVSSLGEEAAKLLAANDFESASEPDELRAVARMSAAALTAADVAVLVAWVDGCAQIWTGPFAKHAEAASARLRTLPHEAPYEQGVEVARLLRERLRIDVGRRVEPEEILRQWKVELTELRLSARHLDAVCTWGRRHGPAIAINRAGLHGRFVGRRATLAHEIGHLLMDRDAALPLGEVLGGSVPQRIEQRARAFAAELLLPQAAVVPAMKSGGDIDEAVRRLASTFGCSLEIVAWQGRNAWGGPLPHDLYSRLRSYVRDPSRF